MSGTFLRPVNMFYVVILLYFFFLHDALVTLKKVVHNIFFHLQTAKGNLISVAFKKERKSEIYVRTFYFCTIFSKEF